jgi:hypothetical protein
MASSRPTSTPLEKAVPVLFVSVQDASDSEWGGWQNQPRGRRVSRWKSRGAAHTGRSRRPRTWIRGLTWRFQLEAGDRSPLCLRGILALAA